MRWIRERAEAVVHLLNVQLNGDRDRFIDFVHDQLRQQQLDDVNSESVQQKEPEPLPNIL